MSYMCSPCVGALATMLAGGRDSPMDCSHEASVPSLEAACLKQSLMYPFGQVVSRFLTQVRSRRNRRDMVIF